MLQKSSLEMLTFSKSRPATSWRSCCMMNAYITATGTSEINRVFDPFWISGGRNMLWVPTCMGHDRRAALRDHYFCYPRPSVLDRNQCLAINFFKETNGSTTISIAKQKVYTFGRLLILAFLTQPRRARAHFLSHLPWKGVLLHIF